MTDQTAKPEDKLYLEVVEKLQYLKNKYKDKLDLAHIHCALVYIIAEMIFQHSGRTKDNPAGDKELQEKNVVLMADSVRKIMCRLRGEV